MYLVYSEEMRQLDSMATEMGIPALVLMENAGRALADWTEKLLDKKGRVTVLAGPGQNGGDGFVAARHLALRGHQVRVAFFGRKERLPREAALNYQLLQNSCVTVLNAEEMPLEDVLAASGDCDVIIDALLGTGASGNPRPPLDAVIRWANSQGKPIVACDLPSGLCADTGFPHEPTIRANMTVTMGFAKVGLFSYPGRDFAGRVIVEPLGMPASLLQRAFSARLITLEDAGAAMPRRKPDHHKGLSGHVTVIAGSLGMAGAAHLAARGAIRAGAGTVTLICPGKVYPVCASMMPEVMVVPYGDGAVFEPSADGLAMIEQYIERSSCIAVGPGFARGTGQTQFLKELLGLLGDVPCVLDADGLYALKEAGGLPYLSEVGGKFVLTPHPKELGRLTGRDPSDISRDRPGYARKAAAIGDCVVCLKGAGTCVANSSGQVFINSSGDPAMATAGAGDVLTGVIAALVAQGLMPFDAAWLGVFWHGLAGEIARRKLGSSGLLAGEIADCLPEARGLIEEVSGPDQGRRNG